MSGGQKQRVAAARAVVTSPRMILADEPTGALDSKSAKMLLERLSYLNQRRGATILMVTHDSLSASYASRIIFLKDGKLFYQLKRGQASRKQLFGKILRVVATLEEGQGDAR